MDLKATTLWLLRDPEPAKWLKMADLHITSYLKLPEKFVLPSAHANLLAIIENFAHDPDAFVAYIKALRDASDGVAFDRLHELYRTISLRHLQNSRRSRIRRAVMLLSPVLEYELQRPLSYDEQVTVGKFVEKTWGAMRLQSLASARANMETKRVSTEARAELLNEFWRGIDAQMDKGVVDLGDRSAKEILKDL